MKKSVVAGALGLALLGGWAGAGHGEGILDEAELESLSKPGAIEQLRKDYNQQKQEIQQELRRIMPKLLADQQQLAAIPIFQPSAGKKDFADYYNRLKSQQPSPLELPEALRTLSRDKMVEQAKSLDLSKLDFSWMKQLADYDHLKISQLSANQASLKQGKAMQLPILMAYPDYAQLMNWSRLRLIQGARQGDAAAAVRDLRQMASLMFNTETLIGNMVGITLLRDESRILDALGVKVPGLAPYKPETLDQARRAMLATTGFFLLGRTPPELFQQLAKDTRVRVALCAAMHEASSSLMLHALQPEANKALLAEITRFAKAHPCHDSLIQAIWINPYAASEAFLRSSFDEAEYKHLQKDAVFREAVYYTLETISLPNILTGYEGQ